MIPRIHKQGSRTIGLLHYLYGPGTHEEHTDPHLVASWDGLAPDPGRITTATLKELQQLLDQPLHLVDEEQRPDHHVWHCSVRAAPGDRILTDDEWGDIARRVVAATGIDPGDGAGCRWAAVRHADDHIHLIATLVREDGHRPDHHRSGIRAQAECRLIEAEYGLTRVNAGDHTAAKRPTSAERHKAQRRGRTRTPREELRESVRRAAAGAASEAEFFARLAAAGLLIRRRIAPSGDILGYTVALTDDRNKGGQPVYYSGSKLAPDLSLPRIRERFTTEPGTTEQQAEAHTDHRPASAPAAARRTATHATWDALLVIEQGDDSAASAQIAAAGEVLDALAKTSAAHTRRELNQAAFVFERASRSHLRAQYRHSRALRRAARDLIYSGPALGRGEDGATTAMVIDMLFFLASTTANWHARHHHAQQAEAARQAAQHLRTAYRAVAHSPLAAMRTYGQNLPATARIRLSDIIRTALPDHVDRIQTEPNWDALAYTLTQAQHAGHDATALLHKAVEEREIDTADSLSDVLIWRLHLHANLPTAAAAHQQAMRSPARSAAANQPSRRIPPTPPSTTNRRDR